MRLRDLPTGAMFRFPGMSRVTEYVARGNGWYGSVSGYDGGPWIGTGEDGYTGSFNPEVEPIVRPESPNARMVSGLWVDMSPEHNAAVRS